MHHSQLQKLWGVLTLSNKAQMLVKLNKVGQRVWTDTLHKPTQATSEVVSCTSMTLVVVVFGVAERVGLGAVLRSKAHGQSVAHDVPIAD